MNKVYEEYKVKKLDSKREKKAQLLGQDLEENINERGDLVGLYTGGNKIIIPNNVKNVLKGSIKLNSKNEELYFGNNIEKYSSLAMKNGRVNNIDKVYIDNERVKVRVNILKNIRNLRYIGSSYTININNKVDYKEFKIALDVRDSTQCREIKFNKNDNMDICNMLEKYIEEEITYKRIDNIDVEVVDTILGQKKWISSDLHNIKSLLYTSRDVVNDLGIKGEIREELMAIIKERFKYIQKVVDKITLKEGVELM